MTSIVNILVPNRDKICDFSLCGRAFLPLFETRGAAADGSDKHNLPDTKRLARKKPNISMFFQRIKNEHCGVKNMDKMCFIYLIKSVLLILFASNQSPVCYDINC